MSVWFGSVRLRLHWDDGRQRGVRRVAAPELRRCLPRAPSRPKMRRTATLTNNGVKRSQVWWCGSISKHLFLLQFVSLMMNTRYLFRRKQRWAHKKQDTCINFCIVHTLLKETEINYLCTKRQCLGSNEIKNTFIWGHVPLARASSCNVVPLHQHDSPSRRKKTIFGK